MIITNVTPRLDRMLKDAVARYRLNHPEEFASNQFLESLIMGWLESRFELIHLEDDVSADYDVNPAVNIPFNLCDDAIDIQRLPVSFAAKTFLEREAEQTWMFGRKEYASKSLKLALALVLNLMRGRIYRIVKRDGGVVFKKRSLRKIVQLLQDKEISVRKW